MAQFNYVEKPFRFNVDRRSQKSPIFKPPRNNERGNVILAILIIIVIIVVVTDKLKHCSASKKTAKLSESGQVEPLIQLLYSSDLSERQAAALALGRIPDTRAVKALFSALSDTSIKNTALSSLGQLGPLSKQLGIQNLRDPNPTIRVHAANVLGATGGLDAVDQLRQRLLYDDEQDVRLAAALALAKCLKSEETQLIQKQRYLIATGSAKVKRVCVSITQGFAAAQKYPGLPISETVGGILSYFGLSNLTEENTTDCARLSIRVEGEPLLQRYKSSGGTVTSAYTGAVVRIFAHLQAHNNWNMSWDFTGRQEPSPMHKPGSFFTRGWFWSSDNAPEDAPFALAYPRQELAQFLVNAIAEMLIMQKIDVQEKLQNALIFGDDAIRLAADIVLQKLISTSTNKAKSPDKSLSQLELE